MSAAVEAPFGAAVRLAGWLNGLAALMIAAFALGVVGGDVDPPDLGLLLECFLAGLGASGLAALFAFLAGLLQARPRGRRWAAALAGLAFAASLGAFGTGCWLAVSQASSDDGDSPTQTMYATSGRL